MESFSTDLRLAARRALARPGFTAVVVLTLALGIGANTAIFSIVHGVLLEPLGFEDESRLVSFESVPWTGSGRDDADPGAEAIRGRSGHLGHSAVDLWHIEKHARSFDAMAIWAGQSMTLEEPGQVRHLHGQLISWDLFPILGLEPLLGRALTETDSVPGKGRTALLSYQAWMRIWGGDPSVIGRGIRIDDTVVTVVGVMPEATDFPHSGVDLWVPCGPIEERFGRFTRQEQDFYALARLAPGVGISAAQEEMEGLAHGLRADFPQTNSAWHVDLRPLRDHFVGEARGAILVVFGAAGLVLLIACANVANLLMVRALSRRREMAVRSALGADRWRLLRQQWTESLILALAGGAAGLLVAVWLHDLLLGLDPGLLPLAAAIDLDWPVFAFALGLALATGGLFGLLPALRSSAAPASGPSARTLGNDARQARSRMLLVAAEMALALALVVGATVLAQALFDLQKTDLGFDPSGVHAAHIILDAQDYGPLETRREYFGRLVERVRATPGIEAAGLTTTPPLPGMGIKIDIPYRFQGGKPLSDPQAPRAAMRVIEPGYLEAVGVPLLRGRNFDRRDAAGAPTVLINRALAERLQQQGDDPLEHSLELFVDQEVVATVIGVVGNTRFAGLDLEPRPAVFFVHDQVPFMGMSVVVRSALARPALVEALEQAVLSVDATQPPGPLRSLESELATLMRAERASAILLSAFGLLALGLAAIGLYGVFSHWVGERVPEIGLRVALGASRGRVLWHVLGRALVVTGLGLVPGTLAALGLGRLLGTTFQGVDSVSPALLVSIAAVLVGVAVSACWPAARRASRIEPIEALREN